MFLRRKLSPASGVPLDTDASTPRFHDSALGRVKADLHALVSPMTGLRKGLRLPRLRSARALTLNLPDRTVTFNGLPEFEFALASRTEFPVHKVDQLIDRSPDELEHLATQIRKVEKRFAEVLGQSIQDPDSVTELLHEIEIKLFSQDHGWREIVEALNDQGSAYDDFKRVVLVKYMQYLGARQDVLRSLYAHKIRDQGGKRGFTPVAATTHDADSRAAPPAEDKTQVASSLKETAIFHLAEIHGTDGGK